MASIYIFCDQDELQRWIADLCKSKDLGILCFAGGDVGDIVAPGELILREDIYQVFLYPNRASVPTKLSMNDVRQREWGWVNIRPGGIRRLATKSVLLFSEIHGEKCDLETGDSEKWVQWLKQRIKPDVHHGVRGRNIVTDGESTYKNIWYTQQARELFEAGVVWKQFPNDNSEFEPLNDR